MKSSSGASLLRIRASLSAMRRPFGSARFSGTSNGAQKAAVVAADEREESAEGGRALLNLGHTFGHALEAESRFDGSVLHGEAVAVGLGLAASLSARLGHCS